jgi:3-phosphoglycerate kinase
MRSITACAGEALKGKRVLVRVGFDVPVENGVVHNDFRIREALPTIAYLTDNGAKVILLSHIGRDPGETLEPVHRALAKYMRVAWMPKLIGDEVRTAIEALNDGDAILLQNLRGHAGEVINDAALATELAGYGDIFVNEAFSVAHREHASIVGIPQHLPSYAGIGFAKEVEELSKAFTPTPPSVFVIGGAKFDTKLPLVKKFMNLYEHVFVCGALAHDLWEARGVSVGGSLTSDVPLTDRDIIDSPKVQLPVDVRTQSLDGQARLVHPKQVGPAEVIMDAGPESVERMLDVLTKGGTLLWNGPLGFYERGFTDGTMAFAEGAARSGARTIVGGGDTVAAIEELGLNDKFTHVSTAGGAMLEFLEKGTLPGIDALATA